MSKKGFVYLVGAGPGDPELLTLKAVRALGEADVVLYDRLIPQRALGYLRPEAEMIYVGKAPERSSFTQEEINRQLVEQASAGKVVVRLKGGDPFIFGRGGEEAQELRAAGIPFAVIPAVTAGIAAPAYAGIPVTYRHEASSVAFVTGHENPAKEASALNWQALADFPGTLVFYMGIKRLGSIAQQLIDHGRSPDQPVAVIERGTYPEQRSVLATLSTVESVVVDAGIKPPAITVVGEVAKLGNELAWFSSGPLAGKSVAVTRSQAGSGRLADLLTALGASVTVAPLVRVSSLPAKIPTLTAYDLLCFTSPNGVRIFFERLAEQGLDARALHGLEIAVIGPGTAAELSDHGVHADLIPTRSVAEDLLVMLKDDVTSGKYKSVLIARPKVARELLPDSLRELGADVETVELYQTEPNELSQHQISSLLDADYVTFASGSSVQALIAVVGRERLAAAQSKLVSIGPITSAALREQKLEPDLEAKESNLSGLTNVIVSDVEKLN